ncbi:MAG TPA: stage III sporulation protein AE [Candidatus Blautia stercorigallinarum]|uniref:Stage III sporulation protein AE n=1 Tax=Candidatus Blautia stercorigallinarum TaxID=2838501 RepID=A0A9D1PER3_9FIRM|nr:stage III sporulation protein AE [Candidatus Blautia stercorigallinarum]
MRRKGRQKKTALLFFLLFLGILFSAQPVPAAGEKSISTGEEAGIVPEGEAAGEIEKQRSNQGESQAEEETGNQNEEALEEELLREQEESQEALLEGLELGEMQEAVNELLGEETFSVREALERILAGEEVFSIDFLLETGKNFICDHLLADRVVLFQVVLLVLLAALFANFTNVFSGSQAGEASFYLVYMLLLALLIHSFRSLSAGLSGSLEDLTAFMQALMPSYFLAVTAASGAATAMVFYEMVLGVIFLIQTLLLKAVIPGIQAYVVIQLINYLHKEDFLSKLAELLKTVLEWSLKTITAVVIGMELIQNMISPALDSLKRDALGKTAAAIPGIGNVIDGATEVALGTAVLIRNCLGATGILVLVILGLPPVIKLAGTVLAYKLLAALLQPVSDKRMTGCLWAMGEGCRLLLKVLLTVELLLLITIAVLAVSFISH